MEEITSPQNPRIRRIIQLQSKARVRKEEGSFITEGVRIFKDTPDEALRAVYVTKERLSELQDLIYGKTRSAGLYGSAGADGENLRHEDAAGHFM